MKKKKKTQKTQQQRETLGREKIDTVLSLPKSSQLSFGEYNPFVHPLSWLLPTENRSVKIRSHSH